MANQGRDEITGQLQLRNNKAVNLGSTNPSQGFLHQAGEGMKHMVQGAATVAQGAVQGATNIAQGTADGVVNIVHGATTAVRDNLGSNTDTTATNRPSNPTTRI